MTLAEQIDRRLAAAREIGLEPLRWIATADVAAEVTADDHLRGLPVEVGEPRSEWGLELVVQRAA